ncbi:uncharacterized protein LOC144636668 isoform X2 [Oculina patagonica]
MEQSAYETFRGGTEVDMMDMDDKVKGAHLRGKKYTVSQNGLCPRCGNSNRLYVILDKLFPMGDMPEILHTLIAKGRAILWSSQEKEGYRDPPTFLCRGFCPPDPLGAGFNVNWGNVSLNQILESLDRPVQAINPVSSQEKSCIQGSSQDELSDNPIQVLDEFRGEKSDDERNTTETSVMQSSSDKEEETEEDDDDDDELDEEELIKQMLAKEQQKLSQENNHDEDDDNDDDNDDNDNEEVEASSAPSHSEDFSEQTTTATIVVSSTTTVTSSIAETVSSTTTSKTASSTQSSYPVSSTGRCPYCGASDVKYIIVVSESTKDTELPQSLQQLLKSNHAFKMAKGDSEPPSFQCQKCQYGFNLNWSKTNLEQIFGLPPTTSAPSTTTPAPHKSTAAMPYQSAEPYVTPAAYPPYPRPSVPPPGYPPPVGIPPPVAYHGYPPTYPSYYGSYYPPPPIPPPVGSYPPYSPVVPPPRIPPPGIRPPGIPPPGILPPGIPPPGIPPPGIPPPGVPPPGVPPPGYPPPTVPPIPPPAAAWGSYPYARPMYNTPPRYPPPTSPGYLPPQGGRPYHLPPQQVRPPRPARPWYQPAVSSGMSAPPAAAAVPTQQESSAEQTEEGENSKVAAARFEMVLNQIDKAKARVRHEKELMIEFQKEVLGTTAADTEKAYQQYGDEPNALTDEGQKVPEYEEKPPGDEDTGFGSNVIITESLEQTKIADSSKITSAVEHSASLPEPMSVDISENPEVATRESDAETNDVVESAVVITDHDSKKDMEDDDVENDLPETVETSPKETVPSRGGRSGRSKQQDKLPDVPAVAAARQTRRSRRSEPANSTEDTDSTAAEEEAVAATGRSRRSRKTRPPSRGVKKLDIGAAQGEEEHGDVGVSDIEMGESSDMLSQSSAVPQTESDSQEVPSESLPSSSETETAPAAVTAIARPQRGRATRGRKRKQGSLEKEAVVSGPPTRKSRRVVADDMTTEERHSEESEEVEYEQMSVETPVVKCQEEDAKMATTSPEVGRSVSAVNQPVLDEDMTTEDSNVVQSEEETTSVSQEPAKPDTETRTGRRQKRKPVQIPQEPDEVITCESTTTPQREEGTVTIQEEDGAQEAEKTTSNRRTRRSTPRNVPQETEKTASRRQTRKSLQMHSQESGAPDTEQQINSNETPESDTLGDDNKLTDSQPSVFVEQKEITSDTYQENEGKANRRTRKSRKSSASSEDASASTRVDVYSSQECDTLMASEEAASNRQTRSRKPPALRKTKATKSDTSIVEEDESTPPTRKSRRSLSSNEDTTTTDVQLSVEPTTPKDSVSSRQTRRNKSTPTAQETTGLSQESDNLTAEGDIEEEDSITPQRRASRKIAPVEPTGTVTKRVTRNRQKK